MTEWQVLMRTTLTAVWKQNRDGGRRINKRMKWTVVKNDFLSISNHIISNISHATYSFIIKLSLHASWYHNYTNSCFIVIMINNNKLIILSSGAVQEGSLWDHSVVSSCGQCWHVDWYVRNIHFVDCSQRKIRVEVLDVPFYGGAHLITVGARFSQRFLLMNCPHVLFQIFYIFWLKIADTALILIVCVHFPLVVFQILYRAKCFLTDVTAYFYCFPFWLRNVTLASQ